MQFIEEKIDSGLFINRYESGEIYVNNTAYNETLLLFSEKVVSPWGGFSDGDITTSGLVEIKKLRPEIVLVGTGTEHRYIEPQTMVQLVNAQIGVEVMTTSAACRTFNILISESRRVLTILLP